MSVEKTERRVCDFCGEVIEFSSFLSWDNKDYCSECRYKLIAEIVAKCGSFISCKHVQYLDGTFLCRKCFKEENVVKKK